VAALKADATGTVKDFRVTDGTGIGVVVELSGGTTTWFFDDEITPA
jgi:ribosomal protein L5